MGGERGESGGRERSGRETFEERERAAVEEEREWGGEN